MRPLAVLILLLTVAGALHAQEQERKLMDRVLQPDMSLGNYMQNKSFNSGGASGLDTTKSANTKDFYFIQKFSGKSYDTKTFASKDYWSGEFQFTTKAANVKTSYFSDKLFSTKTASVKDAYESGKDYSTRDYQTREAIEKGKSSQAHLQEQTMGKTKMNMDDIRTLLNKSH